MLWLMLLAVLFIAYLALSKSKPQDDKPNTKKAMLIDWAKGLTLLAEANGETIQFTYEKYDEPKERRTIDLMAILQNENGKVYLYGFCHSKQENRTFNIDKITTLIKINSKRIDVNDYLEATYKIIT